MEAEKEVLPDTEQEDHSPRRNEEEKIRSFLLLTQEERNGSAFGRRKRAGEKFHQVVDKKENPVQNNHDVQKTKGEKKPHHKGLSKAGK